MLERGESGGESAGGVAAGGAWPPVDVEQIDWTPRRDTVRLADTLPTTYSACVPPNISGCAVQIDPAVAVLCGDAAMEITRFDAELGREIGPFATILLRSESASSSQIEQLTASAKRVLMAEAGDTARTNASQIASNTAAMAAALSMADDISPASILSMHAALLGEQHPDWAGRWRDVPVWIGGRAASPHNADFVAPHHVRVPGLIDDLVAFARRADAEPLIKALIAHAQFETIHPFPDGNGRTGRALVHSLLRRDGLTRNVTVPVSAGLLTETGRYFDALDAYRLGDLNPIVELGAHASLRAIANGRQLADEMRATQQRWADQLAGTRRDSAVWRIIDTLVEHPVIDTDAAVAVAGVSQVAARTAINRLVELEILAQANSGLRFRKWIAVDVAGALDRFAARAGRRGG